MKLLLLIHAASTLSLVGLIWTIQLVHYPLFAQVGGDAYPTYQAVHMRRMILLVLPPMLTELLSAGMLLFYPPSDVPVILVWVALILLAVIWFSTVFVQMPQHLRLTEGFDAQTHRLLVNSNWIRTIAWTLRGLIALWMIG